MSRGQRPPPGDAVGDEGYLKFRLSWDEGEIEIPQFILSQLQAWRERLYAAGVVGAYPNGIGFGNISHRVPVSAATDGGESARSNSDGSSRFYITGSATGNCARLSRGHYALVTEYSLERNTLSCRGLSKASSESLSHAAIYEAGTWIQAVIHIHSASLWTALRGLLPTTPSTAAYGTPEMAAALKQLAQRAAPPAPDGSLDEESILQRVIVMGGHEEGIIAFGSTLGQAGEAVTHLFDRDISSGVDIQYPQ